MHYKCRAGQKKTLNKIRFPGDSTQKSSQNLRDSREQNSRYYNTQTFHRRKEKAAAFQVIRIGDISARQQVRGTDREVLQRQ